MPHDRGRGNDVGGAADSVDGPNSGNSGHGDGANLPISPLASHPAILQHGNGVDPSSLSDFIMSVARMSAARVQGIGAEQYGGEIQKFETMSSEEIFEALLEEVADIFAYASFLAIKAGALR